MVTRALSGTPVRLKARVVDLAWSIEEGWPSGAGSTMFQAAMTSEPSAARVTRTSLAGLARRWVASWWSRAKS